MVCDFPDIIITWFLAAQRRLQPHRVITCNGAALVLLEGAHFILLHLLTWHLITQHQKMEPPNSDSAREDMITFTLRSPVDEMNPFEYATTGVSHWAILLLGRLFYGNPPILVMSYFYLSEKWMACFARMEEEQAKQTGRPPSFLNRYVMVAIAIGYVGVPSLHTLALSVQNYPDNFTPPEYIYKALCNFPWVMLGITSLAFIVVRGQPEERRAFRRNLVISFYRVVLCGDLIGLIRSYLQGGTESEVPVSGREETLKVAKNA